MTKPNSTDKLNSPSHSKLHSVIDVDTSASDGVITIDSGDNVTVTTAPTAPGFNIATKKITVTTFTAAGINTAIDALGADGGEVYLPEGTYVCTDANITIDQNNTTLTGAGAGTILDWSAGTSGYIDITTKTHLTIQNISFLGWGGGYDTTAFIGYGDPSHTAHHLTVQNCWFKDRADAIFSYGDYLKIVGCYFENISHAGVNTGYNEYITVEGCFFNNCLGAVTFVQTDWGTIINNRFYNCDSGINVGSAATKIIIANNVLNLTGGIAIFLSTSCHRSVISNNLIFDTDTGFQDISVGGDHSIIEGNVCYGGGDSDKGIYIAGDYCVVTGNTSALHDVVGIEEAAGTVGNLIYGNNVQDATPYTLAGGSHGTFYQYGDIVNDGDTYWVGAGSGLPFGNFYGNNIGWSSVAFGGGGTFVIISDADITGGQVNLTTFQNNQELLIATTGKYLITWSLSVAVVGASKHIEAAIGVNGTANVAGRQHIETRAAGEEHPMAGTAILALSATNTVSIMVTNIDDNAETEVHHILLTCVQVGG